MLGNKIQHIPNDNAIYKSFNKLYRIEAGHFAMVKARVRHLLANSAFPATCTAQFLGIYFLGLFFWHMDRFASDRFDALEQKRRRKSAPANFVVQVPLALRDTDRP
jgi:hypothetical protein